jgi:hypothetical protein
MARTEARIFSSVWNDDDFRRLSVPAQWLYWALLSQPELSMCGVLTAAIDRWSRLANDLDTATINAALDELNERRFVIHDEATSEVWVRAFVRRDGVLRAPNLVVAMARAFEAIHSHTIRDGLICEILREFPEGFQEGMTERFPKGFPKGLAQRFPQGFLLAVRTPSDQDEPRVPGTLPGRDAVRGAWPMHSRVRAHAPVHPITPSPLHQDPGTHSDDHSTGDAHQAAEPEARQVEEEKTLEETWRRLAEHDLQLHLQLHPGKRIGNREGWLTTAANRRRDSHHHDAHVELTARPTLTAEQLAEILEPTCGPDDGGHARSIERTTPAAAAAEHAQAVRTWMTEADRRIAALTPDDRTQLEQQLTDELGADPLSGLVNARRRAIVMGDQRHPDDGADLDRMDVGAAAAPQGGAG